MNARSVARRFLINAVVYAYGLSTLLIYGIRAIAGGAFLRPLRLNDKLEVQIARDRLWNLSKEWSGMYHHFLTLRSGFKFHYVCNDTGNSSSNPASNKALVILIHGFPDSWALWRYILPSPSLRSSATLVVVDLPGYGGSECLEKYSASNVLDALTEFVISMRMKYDVDRENEANRMKTIIVGHDVGCILSMRLAAEAPQLADRFILTNGPLPSLAISNIWSRVASSSKMLKTCWTSPLRSHLTLWEAGKTILPVVRQLQRSGYVFVFQMPMVFVRLLLYGGGLLFLERVHEISHSGTRCTPQDAAESMACTLGPSDLECKTNTSDGEAYPPWVAKVRPMQSFERMTAYYRDGINTLPWIKSVETIAALHSISRTSGIQALSSGSGVFDDGPKGALKASATIIWGIKDIALDQEICLDGIADYLKPDSQVVLLPRSGHFTPIERESRVALEKAIEWVVKGENEDLEAVMQECYRGAAVTVRK